MNPNSPPTAGADPSVLSAEARTKQRNEAATELVKALLIINGGGAVALLAFLQAVWVSSHVLAKPTVTAIAVLAFGALCAAAFHLFRHQSSWHWQFGTVADAKKFDRFYIVSASLSLIAFIFGISIVVVGVIGAL